MSKQSAKILIVDDNKDILLAAKLLLKPHFSVIHTESNPESIIPSLINENYDVILLDMNFTRDMTSGQEGFYWLDEILKTDPSAIVILMTAYGDIDTAVKAVKGGATDFVLKPWQNEKLLTTLSTALDLRMSRIEVDKLRTKSQQLSKDIDKKYHNMIGVSPVMQNVFNTIDKVAMTDANVLILGENGTGKELVARALHRQSNRSDEVFIGVDVGSINPTLFESEFFGHTKGSFTDAKEDRAGRLEIASGGTLFLDEIGNIPIELQAKLLAVLENREVSRVGSNTKKQIDIRLICATNRSPLEMIAENKFRQDLLYRINTVEINIPPLRKRKEDIPLLAEFFLDTYKSKYNKSSLRYNSQTLKKLENYNWPGNVRELQHAVERCVILCEDKIIQPKDFYFPSVQPEDGGEQLGLGTTNLEQLEKMVIRKVLSKYNGNITKAAIDLGLTRTSLYRRMEKYGL
ncbi:MAG: sigma-54 dependent transcriptional regulator [Ignavibacteria bacterium]|jgi:DNA-binding NtrC family response regulator